MTSSWRALAAALFAAALAAAGSRTVSAQDAAAQGEPAAAPDDFEWPRVIEDGDTTFTVYQPQVDVFENARFEARAAVQVETKVGEKTQKTYGVVWITADVSIDKEARLVQLDNIQVAKANFPTAGEKTEEYLAVFRQSAEGSRTVSLDRIEANLAVTQADRKGNAVPLKNDPPKIYYRPSPAILVLIDGDPALRPIEGVSGVERVVNTRSLILKAGGVFYMPIAGRWLTSGSPAGPWQLGSGAPAPVQGIRDSIAKDENQSQVDLMEETSDDVKGVLAEGKSPEIIVSTVPAELIVTQGEPKMKPVTGTQLLYVENTSGDILLDLKDQSYYVPLTGRWFRARSLEGPWQFVDGDKLPKDFAKIPANDPKSSVLATVPGTPAAQEAMIANSIPQTAEVNREEATFESKYDGEPRFDAVPDTPLQYAVNSPTPVVRVDPTTYYAVQSGVWFTGASPLGPWIVATAVPPVIYTIPTASPIHYVTYVRIYRYTPTVVWVGYTPGYLGTCYSPWGTVVYGTGWYYRPWIGNYWYGAPWTWGFGVGFSWSPWAGWGWSFGWGGYRPYYNPWWGPYYGYRPRPPYYRPPYYGGRPTPYPGYRPRPNWNNMNVYNRPGQPRPGVRPSVRPSTRPAVVPPARPGQPATRPGQPATRPAPSQPVDAPGPTRDAAEPAVDTARAVAPGQRLRGPGRQRVPAAARKAGKLGDQRQGDVETGAALAARDPARAAFATLDAPGSTVAAVHPSAQPSSPRSRRRVPRRAARRSIPER